MIERQDHGEIRVSESHSERAEQPKATWAPLELWRILAGEAEFNPGDSHPDGPSTFS